MAKKKSQTEALSNARWELLRRNIEAKREYDKNEVIVSFRDFCKKHNINSEEIERKNMAFPAATAHYSFIEFTHKYPEFFTEPMSDEQLNEKFLNVLCENARFLFQLLTVDRPFDHLLMGINLTRSKEAIMAEVETLVTKYQNFYRGGKPPKGRLKWLSSADQLLEVWDLYQKAGQQPASRSFKQISKKLDRPLSTIKDQWYQAYKKIYGIPYDPESKYATDKSRKQAAGLCAKCPYGGKCYKNGDQIPCKDYLKIAGKVRRIKTVSFNESILYETDE